MLVTSGTLVWSSLTVFANMPASVKLGTVIVFQCTTPLPYVASTWSLVPSAVGIVKLLPIFNAPAPVISKSGFVVKLP